MRAGSGARHGAETAAGQPGPTRAGSPRAAGSPPEVAGGFAATKSPCRHRGRCQRVGVVCLASLLLRDRSVDGIEIDHGPTGLAIINPWGIFAIDLSSQRFFCTGTRSSPASLVATVTWQVPAVVCQSVEGAPYLLRASSGHDLRSNSLIPTWLWPV